MNLRQSLRLSNIVQSTSGIYLVVTEIMASGITYDRLDGKGVVGHAEWGEVEAVELNEKILKACGFIMGKEIGDRNVGYSSGIHKIEMQVTIAGGVLLRAKKYRVPNIFEHLHLLQNLYFDLTNTELKLTL